VYSISHYERLVPVKMHKELLENAKHEDIIEDIEALLRYPVSEEDY
jgi:hypothetical protein